jgi:predicted transcriptional regulator
LKEKEKEKIYKLLKEKNISVTALCEKMEITRSYFYYVMNGQRFYTTIFRKKFKKAVRLLKNEKRKIN